jgi:hypothetical protein
MSQPFEILYETALVATLLTAPLTFLLLRLYRRYVLRTMGRRVRPDQDASVAMPAPDLGLPVAAPELVYLTDDSSTESTSSGDLYVRMRTMSRRATVIYAAGGLCYAALMTAWTSAKLFAAAIPGITFSQAWMALRRVPAAAWLQLLWLLVTLLSLFVYPALLVINLVTVRNRRSRYTTVGVYVAVYLILTTVDIIFWPSEDRLVMFAIWAIANLAPTLFMAGFLYRGLQGVGPMVYAFMICASFAPMLALGALAANTLDLCCNILIIILPLTVAAGSLLLLVLKWLYQRKQISESSLLADSIWLVFALMYALCLGGDAYTALVTLAGFVLYKITTGVGFALSTLRERRRGGQGAPQLLFLRVFALGRRSEQLYTAVSNAWRYIGSIRLITGPDLATSTVEPHDFFDFVSGGLHSAFIHSSGALERRVATMDLAPDPDGRFRVNDFFCYEDTWRMVLSRLASDNVVVLSDLRQFSAQNAGCIYEITELVNRVPMERVLFVVDESTDEAFLGQTIHDAWVKMALDSPNRQTARSQVRLLRHSAKRSGDYDGLLRALATTGRQ